LVWIPAVRSLREPLALVRSLLLGGGGSWCPWLQSGSLGSGHTMGSATSGWEATSKRTQRKMNLMNTLSIVCLSSYIVSYILINKTWIYSWRRKCWLLLPFWMGIETINNKQQPVGFNYQYVRYENQNSNPIRYKIEQMHRKGALNRCTERVH
jgi:hypothetical protein